jgi:cytochrome P450
MESTEDSRHNLLGMVLIGVFIAFSLVRDAGRSTSTGVTDTREQLTLYKRATSPLSRIPGPFISQWTNLYLKYQVLSGDRVRYVDALHQKYGPIVRISPNEVSLCDGDSAKTIYRQGNHFFKSTFYAGFSGNSRPTLFAMRDAGQHGQHRRLVSASFSDQHLRKMEPLIAKNVRLAILKMGEEAQKHGYVDILKWYYFMVGREISANFLCMRD